MDRNNWKVPMPQSSTRKAFGIDLGTTFSCVSLYHNGSAKIIPNNINETLTPSWVSFDDQGFYVGKQAQTRGLVNPANTVYDVKRMIGMPFSEPNLQQDVRIWPFRVTSADNDMPLIAVRYLGEQKLLAPQQISALFLDRLCSNANERLQENIKDVIITVPAYFSEVQKQATKEAGMIAGLNVIRIISEPTAAAIAFGFTMNEERTILVYDFGGGTFDVSLLKVKGGSFQVFGNGGNSHLGGRDIDILLIRHLCQVLQHKYGVPVMQDFKALAVLGGKVESAKRMLSTANNVRIDLEGIAGLSGVEYVTRADFEKLIEPLVNQTIVTINRVLDECKMTKEMVDDILMVGGVSKIPYISQRVRDFFRKEPRRNVNADEAVAKGAAILAEKLIKQEKPQSFTPSKVGDKNLCLFEVVPLSLGTDKEDGGVDVIVPKGTTIPCSRTRRYMTSHNRQTKMPIMILEGEEKIVSRNRLLGMFELEGIPPGPAHSELVDITFTVNVEGLISATAVLISAGKSVSINVRDKNKLSANDLNTMIMDNRKLKEAEGEKAKKIALLNSFEEYIDEVSIQADSLPNHQKDALVRRVDNALDWIDQNQDATFDAITYKFNLFKQSVQKFTVA